MKMNRLKASYGRHKHVNGWWESGGGAAVCMDSAACGLNCVLPSQTADVAAADDVRHNLQQQQHVEGDEYVSNRRLSHIKLKLYVYVMRLLSRFCCWSPVL